MKTCNERVYSKLDRWHGMRPCQGKVVVTFTTTKGTEVSYCKRHAHRAAEYQAAMNRPAK